MSTAICKNKHCLNNHVAFHSDEKAAANLNRRKHGLGDTNAYKMQLIFINMSFLASSTNCYALLVLNKVLYINYVALAVGRFWPLLLIPSWWGRASEAP